MIFSFANVTVNEMLLDYPLRNIKLVLQYWSAYLKSGFEFVSKQKGQ